jgi:hypothetical protein
MASAEIALLDPSQMQAAIEYAERLSYSGMIPDTYQGKPANILWAMEYGRTLSLSTVATINGVNVIKGKPTASAGLISALVRQAGHKMRIGYDDDHMTGWATIVRADDPEFTFRSEWNLKRAVEAELCSIKDGRPFAVDTKGNSLPWKKFFPSMVKARAITEVSRDACEEILFGLHYTPEELGAVVDEDGSVITVRQEPAYTAQDAADAVVRKAEREMVDAAPRGQTNPLDPDFELSPALTGTASSMPATGPQLTKLNILIGEKRGKLERAEKLALVAEFVGRPVASSAELTLREASDLIERLTLEPPHVADAEFTEDPAEAEAAKLAATDPETDPERIEADLRDALESASSTGDIDAAWVRVQAAEKAGAIGAAAVGRLTTAGARREETLKADAGWSHRTGVGRALSETGAAA